jgi:hypothetical protein
MKGSVAIPPSTVTSRIILVLPLSASLLEALDLPFHLLGITG